ncbi:MAG: hypothetical protein H6612_10185 [Ignavibacteriales bacterium]|nr:hypothetical protein [Ignavibacteriales bacterium]
MKMKAIYLLTIFTISNFLFASEHGIYLLTNKSVTGNIDEISKTIGTAFSNSGYKVQFNNEIHTPDYVREDQNEHCGFKAQLIVLTKEDYSNFLTSYGSKYLVGGFLKIGLFENENGLNIAITDLETINRTIFNDLFENDEVEKYNEVITKTKVYKKEIISLLHKTITSGEKVEQNMEPIRDDEDLAESSKDMFMMVGSLTLFNDEDQFPIIYSTENKSGFSGIQKLKNDFITNIKNFTPAEDDIEYRWYQNEEDLKWKVISQIESPKNNAILLGITRPRTEGVSFNIAGSSRENDKNMCPGIDHAGAYPIEILLLQEKDKINVYTQREMHRMDMYFWDAGMSAFMDHMSMPGILDDSIKKALLGK